MNPDFQAGQVRKLFRFFYVEEEALARIPQLR